MADPAARRRPAARGGILCAGEQEGELAAALEHAGGATDQAFWVGDVLCCVGEAGAGTGVTGGWILDGLPAEGTLTTVDPDSALQTAARDTFARMGVSHTRVRTIAGAPRDVLPRLSDGAYDLVIIGPGTQTEGEDGHGLLAEAHRLLSPGGSLVITPVFGAEGMLTSRHDLVQHVRDDPEWIATVLTVGEGVVLAAHRGHETS